MSDASGRSERPASRSGRAVIPMIGIIVVGLLLGAPGAGANPGFGRDLGQPCAGPGLGGAAAAFIPVAGDPTAYQKCGPAGTPLGIKHCPEGFSFSAPTGYCVPLHGTDATLTVESVWKAAGSDSQVCTSACQPKPIDVKLTYSAASVGSASVTVSDGAGRTWGGSADMLTNDGQTHSIVIAANNLTPQSADWPLRAGDPVQVVAYLTNGKSNPDNDPIVAAAMTTQTLTASAPPVAQ